MSRWIIALGCSAVLGLGIAGCSSSDDDGASRFNAGVDDNARLGDLTPDQRVTICQNQAAFVRARVDTTSLMRFVCAFTPGVFLAATDEACESEMERCVSALSVKVDVTVTDPNTAKTVCATFPVSECDGTVADYENCVDSIANVQLSIGSDFSCGKRADYASAPTVGVNACRAVGPACTAASSDPVIR